MLTYVHVLLLCSAANLITSDYCQDNFTLAEFPQGIQNDVINLLTKGVVADFAGCPDNVQVDANNIHFWLWNNANPITPIDLDKTNPSQINTTNPIIFIIPGWLCNVTNDRVPQLKNAYLVRYGDANIIGVDWTTYSADLYANSFCYIPQIAPIIGAFICNLNAMFNVDITTLHIMGHSMGGQICGLVGQQVKTQCNQTLGRITGLDPAGPLYQDIDPSRRLDASDATIVDVIHTNQAVAGYYGPCGTVDYFPNCGYLQPGCLQLSSGTNVSTILNLPLFDVDCNHLRSVDYFIESISSSAFVAKSCLLCPGAPLVGPCNADLFMPSSSVMGEDYPEYPGTATKYYLQTNSKSPFAQG